MELKKSAKYIALFFVLMVFVTVFGDDGWYESDGLGIMLASSELPEAKSGDVYLYKYPLQPLTYEINHVLYSLLNNIHIFFWVPGIFGAIALCCLWRALNSSPLDFLHPAFNLSLLLLIPEFFYGLLYMNSPVYGMMFFCMALMVNYAGLPVKHSFSEIVFNTIAVSFLFALACLCRFDFGLAFPLFLVWIWLQNDCSWKVAIIFSGTFFLTLLLAFISGLIDYQLLLVIVQSHINETGGQTFWTPVMSAYMLWFSVHWIVWLLIGAASLMAVWHLFYTKRWQPFLLAIAALPLLYPVIGLTSPNYLLPAMCLLPFALQWMVGQCNLFFPPLWFKRFVIGIMVAAVLVQFHTLNPIAIYPDIKLHTGFVPAQFPSHDGLRTDGFYFYGYSHVRHAEQFRDETQMALAHQLVDALEDYPGDVRIIVPGQEYSFFWIMAMVHVPLYLKMDGYEWVNIETDFYQFQNESRMVELIFHKDKITPTEAKTLILPVEGPENRLRQAINQFDQLLQSLDEN